MILLKVILALIVAASIFLNWTAHHKIDELRKENGRLREQNLSLKKENKRLKKHESAAISFRVDP